MPTRCRVGAKGRFQDPDLCVETYTWQGDSLGKQCIIMIITRKHAIGNSCLFCCTQRHRQDLLREGAKMELCHGALTMDFRTGCSRCLMTNSFLTNAVYYAVLIERAVSCWHLHQLISQTTKYLDSWLSDLFQSELKWNCWKSMGHVPQCPIASDATGCT